MAEIWYVRRGPKMQGPFPSPVVSRFISRGRLLDTDELSRDMKAWRPLSEIRRLFAGPQDDDPPVVAPKQRPRPAQGDSAATNEVASAEPGEDSADTESGPAHRVAPARRKRPWPRRVVVQPEKNQTRNVASIVGLLGVILAVSLLIPEKPSVKPPQCDAAPAPGVNWSGCRLEEVRASRKDLTGAVLRNVRMRGGQLLGAKLVGADLAYAELIQADLSYADLSGSALVGVNLQRADLSYANLGGADLTYADLRGANLGGADLSNARFDNAIWVDSAVCQAGSIGRCLPRGGSPSSKP
jgi:hypothetical protein